MCCAVALGCVLCSGAALQEDTSWVAMKTFLGKRSVKEDILSFDAHRILSTPGEERRAASPMRCMHEVASNSTGSYHRSALPI